MWTMGIDMGTSGCKAVVFDEQFAIRATINLYKICRIIVATRTECNCKEYAGY